MPSHTPAERRKKRSKTSKSLKETAARLGRSMRAAGVTKPRKIKAITPEMEEEIEVAPKGAFGPGVKMTRKRKKRS